MIVRVAFSGGERRVLRPNDAAPSDVSFLAEIEGDEAKVLQFVKDWIGGANAKYASQWLGLEFRCIKGKSL